MSRRDLQPRYAASPQLINGRLKPPRFDRVPLIAARDASCGHHAALEFLVSGNAKSVEKQIISRGPALQGRQRSNRRAAAPKPKPVNDRQIELRASAIYFMFEQPHFSLTDQLLEPRRVLARREKLFDVPVQHVLRIVCYDPECAIENAKKLRRAGRCHADSRTHPDSIEIRRQSFSTRRRQG